LVDNEIVDLAIKEIRASKYSASAYIYMDSILL